MKKRVDDLIEGIAGTLEDLRRLNRENRDALNKISGIADGLNKVDNDIADIRNRIEKLEREMMARETDPTSWRALTFHDAPSKLQ